MDYSRNQRRNSQAIRMQQEHIDKGKLQIQITSQVTAFPIQNAQVSISYTGVPENTLEKLQTDSSGQTEEIELTRRCLVLFVCLFCGREEPVPWCQYAPFPPGGKNDPCHAGHSTLAL